MREEDMKMTVKDWLFVVFSGLVGSHLKWWEYILVVLIFLSLSVWWEYVLLVIWVIFWNTCCAIYREEE